MQQQTGILTGLHNIKLFTQQWFPDSAPRAVVLLVHGYGEHSGRYHHVAARLAACGYAVYALDHRGHGQSEGQRVQIDRFEDYVADLTTYFQQIRAQHPGVPIFVYGHSMGSLISLLFAFEHQDEITGLITSGTALRLPLMNGVTSRLIHTLRRVIPNVRLIPLDVTGISRDAEVVRRYIADPLVSKGLLRVGLVAELQRASERCKAALPALCLPYLALHGGADRITLPGGAEIIRRQCGAGDLTVKVYDGLFHEVHNEPEQEQVIRDMIVWLDAHNPS